MVVLVVLAAVDVDLVVRVNVKRVVLGVVQLDIIINRHLIIIIGVVEDRRRYAIWTKL